MVDVKKVEGWKSSDGTIHDTELQATAHELGQTMKSLGLGADPRRLCNSARGEAEANDIRWKLKDERENLAKAEALLDRVEVLRNSLG